MAPAGMGARPAVSACSLVEGDFDVQTLGRLSAAVSLAKCPWVVALDYPSYNILVIEEPPVKPAEMEQSVRWAISTLIDYPVAEASVAWMRIPTAKQLPNRPPHIYAVSSRREVVDGYRAVFRQAKLPLLAIDVRETAHRNVAALVARPGEGVAFLSVGQQGMQLTVTFDGELYLDRHIEESAFAEGADESALERARERVVLQVQRSLDFVGRTLPFIDVTRVLMAPMRDGAGLRERIAENLPVPVESLDLAEVLDISKVPQLRDAAQQADYLVALGTALRFMGEGSA